jgi:chromosome partitioning protein
LFKKLFSGGFMPVILVANPKGGVGKSTLSTNIAGYFARQGHSVMLGDIDRQQSSRAWLQLRHKSLPLIQAWDIEEGHIARPPKGTTHVVLDTPAGLNGEKLKELLKLADRVVVPLQPSMFDILATREFLSELAESKSGREGKAEIGIVGMRVDARTRAAEQLEHYLDSLGLPVLGMLRDTQNYVQASAHGLTIWDVAVSRVEKDLEQWQPLLAWLNSAR